MCCKELTRKVLYSWGIGALLFLQLVAGSSPPETGREEKIASILSPADIRSLHHQCIGGDRDACFTLGLAYLEGDGVRANRRTAYDLARTLCETGDQRACGLQAYIASLKNPPEWESEAELLRRAFSSCEKRSPLGCYTAAQLLRQKSIPEDLRANHPDLPGNTLSLLRKQCARGLRSTDENYIERRMGAITCDLLSAIYFEETLTSKDETLAVAYLRKACSLSSPDACAAMAISYEEGLYFPKDIRKAAEAYAVACAYRDRNGEECNTLARWYLEGKEGKIEKSLEKAIRYYRYSCRHQSNKADACDLADSLSQKQRSNEIKERIRSIILHGYDDPTTALGSMPPGMASGEDAVALAEYLAKGMRGEKPAAFAVCASCHGPDGDGIPGVGPSLKNLSSTGSGARETQAPPTAPLPKSSPPKTLPTNLSLYETGCRRGEAPACYRTAMVYLSRKSDVFKKQGQRLLKNACRSGVDLACYHFLSQMGNNREAMERLQTSCRNGNAEGCSLLGFLSNKAKHSGQDLRLSKKYYRQMTLYAQKACEKLSESLCVDSRCLNASENCNLAGLGYGNGLGVAKNTSLSARFYEKSCRMGNAEGCLVAGTGDLLTHRLDKAVSALKRACTLGNGMGCLTLAMEYDGPNYGLKKDPAKAGIYYEKSCRISENAFACQRAKELMP